MIDRLKRMAAFLLLTNKSFRLLRWLGVHVTPVHFYSPVPDTRQLPSGPEFWERPAFLTGISIDDAEQRRLMQDVFAAYQQECSFPRRPTRDPSEFFTENGYFGHVSAAAMHSMIRHHRPRRIIEVGAGYSTQVVARAARMNAQEGFPAEITVIDPYPKRDLLENLPGIAELIPSKVEDLDLERLAVLEEGDILSIDTSHAVRCGGDVVFLHLRLFPLLAKGVLVHIHDIFLPFEYPRVWLQRRHFWNEQYLFCAFLLYNSAFQVVWAQKYAEVRFEDLYRSVFEGRVDEADNSSSYSYWIRRVSA